MWLLGDVTSRSFRRCDAAPSAIALISRDQDIWRLIFLLGNHWSIDHSSGGRSRSSCSERNPNICQSLSCMWAPPIQVSTCQSYLRNIALCFSCSARRKRRFKLQHLCNRLWAWEVRTFLFLPRMMVRKRYAVRYWIREWRKKKCWPQNSPHLTVESEYVSPQKGVQGVSYNSFNRLPKKRPLLYTRDGVSLRTTGRLSNSFEHLATWDTWHQISEIALIFLRTWQILGKHKGFGEISFQKFAVWVKQFVGDLCESTKEVRTRNSCWRWARVMQPST